MSSRPKHTISRERLRLRLTPSEKGKIKAAAAAESKPLSGFVLESALATANHVLTGRHALGLSAKQWKEFIEALDAPPRSHDRPRRPSHEPSASD